MNTELTFDVYGKDENNNIIFISNEGKYYNENGNIINIKDMKIDFDIEDKTPNIFDDSSDSEDDE
jgi:hypothetical protein